MEKEKKWFFRALGLFVLIIGLLAAVNILIDPYGLFKKDFADQFVEPNKNFIKVRYVTDNPDRYDCFVFGSSRVNSVDARKIKGYRCYNMTYNGGLPGDHLKNLRYMVEQGVKVKLVLIGLDDFVIRDNPVSHLTQPLRHPYPPVIHESVFLFF